MAKVHFQVDGLDSNTDSIFNDDVTFEGNVDAASISIDGTAITEVIQDAIGNSPFALSLITINQNETITAGYNAWSVGPVTIAPGVTVTIPTGSTWLISQ